MSQGVPLPNPGMQIPPGKKLTPQQQQQIAAQQQQQRRPIPANGPRPPGGPGQQGSPPMGHQNGIPRQGMNGFPNGDGSSPGQGHAALPGRNGSQQPFLNGGGFPENGNVPNGQQRAPSAGARGPAVANYNFDATGGVPSKEQQAALKLQMQRAAAQAQSAAVANGSPASSSPAQQAFQFNGPVLNLKPPPPGRNGQQGTPAQQAAWRASQAARQGAAANGQSSQMRNSASGSPVPPHMSPRAQHVGSG